MTTPAVLLRHGESTWNAANRFTGWTDVELTRTGEVEAEQAARLLVEAGLRFDRAFTSVLARATHTLDIVLDRLGQSAIPVTHDWRLNERHYGALQGLNKADTAERLGKEQVQRWRRSFEVRPPALDPADDRHPRHDPRYAHLDPAQLPATESLQDTLARVLPCWEEAIAPRIRAGERVLVVAHGNSLRALVMHLDRIAPADVPGLHIPTGIPLVYAFDDALQPQARRYLSEPAAFKAAVAAALAQEGGDHYNAQDDRR